MLLSTFFVLKTWVLQNPIQNKRHGMLTYSVVLLHDNAHSHTAAHTLALLEHFNWELLDHPSYSPDLASSSCHLCTYLKNWWRSQCFNNNKELMESVRTCLSSQAADFFVAGIQKLISQYNKCLSSSDDCVEKKLKYVCISFVCNKICFSQCLLTAHQRLHSKYPSYLKDSTLINSVKLNPTSNEIKLQYATN
jgi:hypothetical protein